MDDIQAMTDALPEASDTTAVTPTASPDDAAPPPSAGDGDALTVKFNKQTVTINVELFGRETPVEISFAEVRKSN